MVIALIVSIAIAIVFASLYLDERTSSREIRNEFKSIREAISRLKKEDACAEHSSRIDDKPEASDSWDLTHELVADAVKYNGFVPIVQEGYVEFLIQGERYFIRTDRLPYLMLEKPYALSEDDFEIDVLRQAANKITDDMFIGKVSISPEGNNLRFQADAYEPKYGHLRDSLRCYLNVIHEQQTQLKNCYDNLIKQREDRKQLEQFGFHPGKTNSSVKS